MTFPDEIKAYYDGTAMANNHENSSSEDVVISNIFFELANKNEITYHICNKVSDYTNSLVFQQDTSGCAQHTGGIIWETSYLLLQYLLSHQCDKQNKRLGRTLELGAGVGFLGQCLASENCCYPHIVLTETAVVVGNLRNNANRNRSVLTKNTDCKVYIHTLDWVKFDEEIDRSDGIIQRHEFDTLLGTDIIFSSHLVEPLLRTAAALSHKDTIWYLCVQIRCETAHQLFISKAPVYGFIVENISSTAFGLKNCAWGKVLDCYLFRITRENVI